MFLAANVLIDVEVLAANHFSSDWRVHQFLHFHTLLIGGLAGAALGVLFYYIKPLRRLCELGMGVIGLPYRAKWWSMAAGGLLGVWLHVLIDSFYHYDVQIFWPYKRNPINSWMRRQFHFNSGQIDQAVETVCLIFWGLLIALYLYLLFRKVSKGWKSRA